MSLHQPPNFSSTICGNSHPNCRRRLPAILRVVPVALPVSGDLVPVALPAIVIGGIVDPARVAGIVDPARVAGIEDPARVTGMVDPARVTGIVDPAR
ncbi:unnamed protein product, partial [Rotaria socialis]